MTENEKQRSGFIGWLQRQPGPVRLIGFFLIMTIFIMTLVGAVAFIYRFNVSRIARVQPITLLENEVTVREYVRFPDDDAYPAALAVSPDGTLISGSYASGVVWEVSETGAARALNRTRGEIGSIVGLDFGPDGALYIADRIDPLDIVGTFIWRIDPDGELVRVLESPATDEGSILLANDITVDSEGRIYVADLGNQVWRFAPDGSAGIAWWSAPETGDRRPAVAGLAYDAANDRILVTDVNNNNIYAIAADATDPATEAEVLYEHANRNDTPGLNGIDVAEDGTIYVAALDLNRVARLESDADGTRSLVYLASAFRGSSDVAYDPIEDRLFVNNWDQRWLQPVNFLFISFEIEPRLPFSVDVIEFIATGPENDSE